MQNNRPLGKKVQGKKYQGKSMKERIDLKENEVKNESICFINSKKSTLFC